MRDFFKNLFGGVENSNLSRYYTGAILIIIVALVIILNIKFIVWLAIGICYILAFMEAMKLYNIEENGYLYTGVGFVWLISYFIQNPVYVSMLMLVIFASYYAYTQTTKSKEYLLFIYPTIPFLCFFSIYKNFGVMMIVWLIVVVALADICAYFGGRAFGKSPLCPVSPKKTLEGALIGLVVATLIGTVIGQSGYFNSFFISLFVAIASIFGDLYESLLKRAANVKDSGNILPGHGGMLDRVDGLLFGSVVMLFLLDWLK